MTQSLTHDLDTHVDLAAGQSPVHYISADEMAYHRARAAALRAATIGRIVSRLLAFLFDAPAAALPNHRIGGKLVTAE